MKSSISDLLKQLRDLINEPRRNWELMHSIQSFNQLCSAIDVISDTDSAIEAYIQSKATEDHIGMLYLQNIGVLQALVLQQDAMDHIKAALEISGKRLSKLEELKEIRIFRNEAIGHPSKGSKSFHHISQISLNTVGFELHTHSGWQCAIKAINLPERIRIQQDVVQEYITDYINEEKKRKEEHCNMFKGGPFTKVFPLNHDYYYEKLGNEIVGSRRYGLGPSLLETFEKAIEDLIKKLDERGEREPRLNDLKFYTRPALNAIYRLHEYFTNANDGFLNEDDAMAFLLNLELNFEKLFNLAVEIDRDYFNNSHPIDE